MLTIHEQFASLPDIRARVVEAIKYLSCEGYELSPSGIVQYLGWVREGMTGQIANGIGSIQERVGQYNKEGESMNAFGARLELQRLREQHGF